MYFDNDYYSIYYEKFGTGDKTILILPGWGYTRCTFYNMIEYFENDYTIYIFDYPGFGRSIFPDTDLTIYDYTNIIRDFIEREKIINPIVIAHSFGGRISILLDGYYKEKIDKLVLIDAAGIKPKKSIFKRIKQTTYKILKKMKFILPKRKRSIYLKRLLKIFGSVDYKNLDTNMYNTFKNVVNEDLKQYIKYMKSDTLIIWGKKDNATPLKDGIYMKKNISMSNLVVFDDAGHFTYLNYKDEVNELIDKFIKDE